MCGLFREFFSQIYSTFSNPLTFQCVGMLFLQRDCVNNSDDTTHVTMAFVEQATLEWNLISLTYGSVNKMAAILPPISYKTSWKKLSDNPFVPSGNKPCWWRSVTSYGITRPQGVKKFMCPPRHIGHSTSQTGMSIIAMTLLILITYLNKC